MTSQDSQYQNNDYWQNGEYSSQAYIKKEPQDQTQDLPEGESSNRASELANNFLTNLTFTEAFSKLETSETTGDSKGKSELNKRFHDL